MHICTIKTFVTYFIFTLSTNNYRTLQGLISVTRIMKSCNFLLWVSRYNNFASCAEWNRWKSGDKTIV